MQKHWIESFQQARRSGSHAFLFTGSVGDGFPSAIPRESAPADVLCTLEDMIREHCAAEDKNALIWTFDPVNGFLFRNAKDEDRFRSFVGLKSEPAPGDAIANATQDTTDAMPLPSAPLDAVRLMRTALMGSSAAARPQTQTLHAGNTFSPVPVRCVAILTHADVFVSAGADATGSRGDALTALALLQIISDDALRRAGHLIVLTAPTASSVHEILRRPDGPLTTIVIGKPNAEERHAFVEQCSMTSLSTMQQHIADVTKLLDGMVSAERERISLLINEQRAKLAEHQNDREESVNGNQVIARAQAARVTADLALQKALEERDATVASIRNLTLVESDGIEKKLGEQSGAFALEKMDADVWRRLQKGDAVRFPLVRTLPNRPGAPQFMEFVVMEKVTTNNTALLAFPDKPEQPIANCTSGTAIFYRWENGTIIGNINPTTTIPLPMPVGALECCRVTAQRRQAERRLNDIKKELAGLQQGVPPSEPKPVRDARAACKQAEDNLERALTQALSVWQDREKSITSGIAVLEREYRDPKNGSIAKAEGRKAQLEQDIAAIQQRGFLPPPRMGVDAFVRLTQGLSYRDIATLLRDPEMDEAAVCSRRITLLNRSYGDVLQVINPSYGFEGLAGLDHVKRVMLDARDAILRGDIKAVPQGIVLMGPPGTGKTAIAIAFARVCGMLLVKLGNLFNKYVGESERRVELACQALLDLAPIVCFRDEADQEDNGRDAHQGDSGVSNRMRQRFMEFEADERIRGRVLFVKATNRPELMDAAMKRDGRADERIVVVTGEKEYAGLFPVYVKREGFPCDVTDFAPFAALVRKRGFSGAAVLNICRRAYQFGSGNITAASLREAIEDAHTSADPVQEAKMIIASICAVSSRRNLPENADQLVSEAQAILRRHPKRGTPAPVSDDDALTPLPLNIERFPKR